MLQSLSFCLLVSLIFWYLKQKELIRKNMGTSQIWMLLLISNASSFSFFYVIFLFLCIIFFWKERRRCFELQVIFWGSFPYSACFPTKSFFQLTVAGLTGVLGVHALLPVAVELKHEIAAAPTPLLPMVVRNALDLTQRPSNAELWFVRVSTTAARA